MLYTVYRSVATPLALQVRGMATLKDIRLRLKSVKNIQKITQSMKMVSAAKYARAERDLKPARPYGQETQTFYECTELAKDEKKPCTLVVAMTSDRGLCGGIHTNVAKKVKSMLTGEGQNIKVICIGDKSRALLQRQYGKNILMVFNEYGKKPPSFADAVKVANAILESGHEFNKGLVIYNRFKTVVSYITTEAPIFSLDAISSAEKLNVYDSLDAEVIHSYQEFSLASIIYYAMKENACSEQSSRMTAMDGATKNAGEMIEKLTLTFNRTRQAVITRELIEIISGAAAL
uniref:F-ATPase gamma subunit n=1 Tax=Hadrurus spadix TaxID=141984 RepID=A0A1W7RAX5_9SCOR